MGVSGKVLRSLDGDVNACLLGEGGDEVTSLSGRTSAVGSWVPYKGARTCGPTREGGPLEDDALLSLMQPSQSVCG